MTPLSYRSLSARPRFVQVHPPGWSARRYYASCCVPRFFYKKNKECVSCVPFPACGARAGRAGGGVNSRVHFASGQPPAEPVKLAAIAHGHIMGEQQHSATTQATARKQRPRPGLAKANQRKDAEAMRKQAQASIQEINNLSLHT